MDREESAYAEGGEGRGGDAGEALAVGLEEGVVLPLLGLAEEPDLQLGALRRGLLADHLPPQQHGERHRRRAAPRGHRHRLGPRRHAPPPCDCHRHRRIRSRFGVERCGGGGGGAPFFGGEEERENGGGGGVRGEKRERGGRRSHGGKDAQIQPATRIRQFWGKK